MQTTNFFVGLCHYNMTAIFPVQVVSEKIMFVYLGVSVIQHLLACGIAIIFCLGLRVFSIKWTNALEDGH